jgi:predicted small metal-binding protein
MSDALILEFKGTTADQCNAVNTIVGIDPATGEGDWPAGLLSHTGAAGDGGDLVVFEVWDSQESQGAFHGLAPRTSARPGRVARASLGRVAVPLGGLPHPLSGPQMDHITAIQEGLLPYQRRRKMSPMGRVMVDCRKMPSDMNCSLTIAGNEEEVLKAAAQHAVSVHGHEDGAELREGLKAAFEPAEAAMA